MWTEEILHNYNYAGCPLHLLNLLAFRDLKADTLADQQEGNQKHRQHLQIDQSPRTSTIHPSQWIATKKPSNMARKQINYSTWQLSGIIHQPRPKPCQIEQYSLSFQTCYTVRHSPDTIFDQILEPHLQVESSQPNEQLYIKLHNMPQPTVINSGVNSSRTHW